MKSLKKIIPGAILALILMLCGCCPKRPVQTVPYNPITPERKATHMITYYAKDNDSITEPEGACTGTAVGPHALLTALHCDEGKYTTIRLDLYQEKFHIIGIAVDGRDHIIYHLDGPALKNVVMINEREAILGERVISYGDGKTDYPQHTYVGRVIEDVNGGDTSELDAVQGTHCFSLPVKPGDSGSAIYGVDGSIVALVSLGDFEHGAAVGFSLAFSPEVLDEIKQ